jgi:hypothetical protein
MSFADEVRDDWLKPGAQYRSAPFWSWNAQLEPDRLCRQIQSMHDAGMGGFFMHSRYGLQTPYLSDEWFTCISACVDKARELGMKAYLYDEDRWPSGPAGGAVTREQTEYRVHYLLAEDPESESDDADRMGLFRVVRDTNGYLTGFESLENLPDEPGPDIYVAYDVVPAADSPWHNDGAYLDTMNPDAVAEFIRLTHQAYADRYGKDFGGVIPAIFTDEPNYGSTQSLSRQGKRGVHWTPQLPREFRKRRGYDLRNHLPELFESVAGESFSPVRRDYYLTLTELFVESFSRQVGRWCDKHRIALTGHMLSEQNISCQTDVIGSAMPHYEHMQWPGIDILTDQAYELVTAKQCSSVADQLGKQRVLSELYGCTGWDWPLEGHKFVGDWHLAAGINFRCPHLAHYSLAGGAKRDYPASLRDHSPWWPYYRIVEDYFARLNLMLTQGKPVRDVLVIHPIESAWGLHLPDNSTADAAQLRLTDSLEDIVRMLSGQHYDWDFGDESLLARHAKASSKGLTVGRMTYKLVVIPPLLTLRESTVTLLGKFIAAGGTIVQVGEPPALVDGRPDEQDALSELISSCTPCPDEPPAVQTAIEDVLDRRVRITENGQELDCVWAMLRSVKGGHLLFIQSHDRREAHTVHVEMQGRRPVVLWRPCTGKRSRVKSHTDNGMLSFELDLPPTGSALVSVGLSTREAVPARSQLTVEDSRPLEGPFDIELTEPNTLPLDTCTFRVADEEMSEPVPTLEADRRIRARYGLGTRLGREHQPWYLYTTGVVDTAQRDPVEMAYTFHVTDVPSQLQLAIERPNDFEITVNDQPTGEPAGHWVDEDIRTIDITGLVRQGDNTIALRFAYRPTMELEPLALVGRFGTSPRRQGPLRHDNVTLTAEPTQLDVGSWVGQGLDFYTGSVRYRFTVPQPTGQSHVRLRLPQLAATAAVVEVAGHRWVLPWPPYEAEITAALSEGDNEVVVEVIGGRKNTLGPLHTPWRSWTGPDQFSPSNKDWTDDYLLTDHGLTGPPVLDTLG